MMTLLSPGQLTPPLMEELQFANYISSDVPLLSPLTYMDGNKYFILAQKGFFFWGGVLEACLMLEQLESDRK